MSQIFEIKRVILEKQLQNLNIQELEKTLMNTNLSFAIDLLSVDKNIKLLSKKADFIFLSKLFKRMGALSTKKPHSQFLRTSNDYFKQSVLPGLSTLFTQTQQSQFQEFIEKVIDLSISQNKKHSIKEIETVINIAQHYNINAKKLVNWLGKITSHTNTVSFFNEVSKLNVLQNKEFKTRFSTIIINMTNNIHLLNGVFDKYTSEIYTLYANYKDEKKTWNCLLPQQSWYSGVSYLPYIDDNKIEWLEDKKIGYKNNPVYFELYSLERLFKESKYHPPSEVKFNSKMTEDSYKNLIHESLQDYKNEYLPKKSEIAQKNLNLPYDEQESFHIWVKESPLRSILSIYDQNPEFYNFCQKITFKIHLEEKLVPNNTKEKKHKI